MRGTPSCCISFWSAQFSKQNTVINFSIGPIGAQLGPIADLGPMGRPLRFLLNSPQTLSLANSKIWLKKPTRRLKGKGPYWAPKGPKSPITRLLPRSQKDPRSWVRWVQGLGPWWILDLARPFCRGTLETQDLKIVICRKTLETQDLKILICSETLETQDLKISIVARPWKPRTGADPGFSLGRGSRSKRRPHVQVAPLFRLRCPLAYGVAYRYLLR